MKSEIVAVQSFQKGEVIFREGEIGRTAFLVRDGLVALARERSANDKQVVGRAGPGQVFGEHALLSIGARPNTAVAEKLTSCVVVHRDKLTEKLKTEDPFIAALYNILATNMRSMIDQGTDLECLLDDLSEGSRVPETPAAKPAPAASAKPTAKPAAKPTAGPPASPPSKPAQAPPPDDDDDAFLI